MIIIKKSALKNAALLTLLLPPVSFLLTWVRPVIGVPCALGALLAFCLYVRSNRGKNLPDAFCQDEDVLRLSPLCLAAVLACALLWTFLSGIGGMFYQNEDHYGRNAIFHDLLNHGWPVYFEGTSCALTYYIAYWLLPALVGKLAAAILGAGALWTAANAALFVQTVWFLVLIFLMLLCLARADTLPRVCAALLVFVLFSGMDGLMAAHNNDWNQQIEWWAGTYQFSSHTTCLFWVYNQSVPAWLAVLLLMMNPADIGSFALIGLAALPFSPMPFLALAVFFFALAAIRLVRDVRRGGPAPGVKSTLSACLTARNLLACACLAPVFALYFAANQSSSDAPLRADLLFTLAGTPIGFARLVLFWLVEFGALALVLGAQHRKNPLFLIAVATLLVSPVLQIGYKFDFSMRFSIPGLAILSVMSARMIVCAIRGQGSRYPAFVLALLLAIGAITPMLEFERGAYKVMLAGANFMYSDPYGTVMHPDADTYNFVCMDVHDAPFYRFIARKGPDARE